VIYAAASEHKKRARSASSSLVPRRRKGTLLLITFLGLLGNAVLLLTPALVSRWRSSDPEKADAN